MAANKTRAGRRAGSAYSLCFPILQLEPFNTCQLTGVMRHHGELVRQPDGGNPRAAVRVVKQLCFDYAAQDHVRRMVCKELTSDTCAPNKVASNPSGQPGLTSRFTSSAR